MTRRAPLLALSLLAATTLLGGCNLGTRLSEVGAPPAMTNVVDPTRIPGYQPVSMPMPAPPPPSDRQANSLWRPGARAFFKDQRAARVGDILTVLIRIDDKAELKNETTRTRDNKEDAAASNFFGLQSKLANFLPKAVNPASLVNLNSDSSSAGTGKINRDEAINLRLAATITQTLPNGNLVIQGRQEVRVNYELRELQIAGVIRPEDLASDNSIGYEKIAEARIGYGGRGQIIDVQQPRYGQQLLDIVMPF